MRLMLKGIGAVPWAAMLTGMPFLNRSEPFVLGLPLPLAWVAICTLLSAVALAIVYVLDPANAR